jgi:hypothetical protein
MHHTVYEGEIVGQILVQELLHKQASSIGRVSMYIDNEASICSAKLIKPTPSHYLTDLFHKKVIHTKKKHCNANITLHWIPRHLDILGNEEANRQAKKEAKGDANSPLHRLPKELRKMLQDNKSAIKQGLTKRLCTCATALLCNSPQWPQLTLINPSMPSAHFRKIVKNLP